MENTNKQLTALTSDSIRRLIDTINERKIMKEDVLKLISKDGVYFLLYYESCD